MEDVEAPFISGGGPGEGGLFRHLKILSGDGKKDEFKQERTFGRAATIPIANTINELVEMDFVECGDYSAFLYMQDAFSLFSVVVRIGSKKKGERTSEMVLETVISHWLAAFGALGIFIVGGDM